MEDYSIGRRYTFKEKAENYWYHYKWHTIIALFLIFAVTVCALQFCKREEYDVHVMYAGRYALALSQQRDAMDTLQTLCPDYNDDGESLVTLTSLFLMNKEQIEAENAKGEGDVNVNLIRQNMEIFDQTVQGGEAVIFFLDPYWADYLWSATEEDNVLLPIAGYAPQDSGYEFYNDYGIYLRSTKLYEMAGFNNMPDDTVICIRKNASLASIFNKKAAERNHKNSEELLKIILGI